MGFISKFFGTGRGKGSKENEEVDKGKAVTKQDKAVVKVTSTKEVNKGFSNSTTDSSTINMNTLTTMQNVGNVNQHTETADCSTESNSSHSTGYSGSSGYSSYSSSDSSSDGVSSSCD